MRGADAALLFIEFTFSVLIAQSYSKVIIYQEQLINIKFITNDLVLALK
ncbi:hypothetical protein MGI18_19790 [Bacillus sp. OVS6]|nr:hypothetical protein MGI18_19790 [Bacillus sp. OVS6]